MSGANTGEDCHFFVTAECNKGEACPFRHSEAAKANTTVCSFWLAGHCGRLSCGFRHPSLPKSGAAPMAAGRGRGAFAMNPFQMMPMMAPAGCKYFLQGSCRNGATCPFGHGGFIGGFPQQQQQMLQQFGGGAGGGYEQQSQQQDRKDRKPKRDRDTKEPREGGRQKQKQQQQQQRDTPIKTAAAAGPPETDEQKRERLLSKPLPPVRSKKVGAPPAAASNGSVVPSSSAAASNAVIVSKGRREEESPEPEPEQVKKPKTGRALVDVPLGGGKSAANAAAKKAEPASVVKTLAQIIAEKDAPTPVGGKSASLDAELLALGIEPSAKSGGGGGGGAVKAASAAAAKSAPGKPGVQAYADELRAMGLDLDDFAK